VASPNDVPPHDAATWTEAAREGELWEGGMFGVVLGGTEVLLVKLEGEVRAYRNRCPHQGTPLDRGWIDDGTLTCSGHMWEFDVLSGEGVVPRGCALVSYPVRIERGTIWVAVPD
jgi:toluene monooxygenase system ferredoxin subunit